MLPRATALGIVVRDGYALVEEFCGEHSQGTGAYCRLLGGTIEFGERSADTVVREFREELGVEVSVIRYLGCIENIFEVQGRTGHEIVQLYEVRWPDDERARTKDPIPVTEGQRVGVARWIKVAELLGGGRVLYPTGVGEAMARVVGELDR
jgi:ADP-ribose pyrophosphatase YjhB (NUDIX family)